MTLNDRDLLFEMKNEIPERTRSHHAADNVRSSKLRYLQIWLQTETNYGKTPAILPRQDHRKYEHIGGPGGPNRKRNIIYL